MLFFPKTVGLVFFFINPDHSTDSEKGTVPPTAEVAKPLRAESGPVGNAGNA